MTLEELRERLLAEGLLEPDEGQAWQAREGSAWYLSLLIGLGAWVAALLILLVLGLLGLLHEQPSALVLGLVGLGGAMALSHLASSEFLRQLGLAILLASQVLVMYGLADLKPWLVWGGVVDLVLLVVLVGLEDRAGRILTALVMGLVVVTVASLDHTLPAEVHAMGLALLGGFCWLRQRWLLGGRAAPLQAPLGYASLINLFILLQVAWWGGSRALGGTCTVLLTAAVLWMVARLQAQLRLPMGAGLLSLGAVLALGAVTLQVPGVMAGVGVLMLGFAARNRVVQGLAWLYLLTFGSSFYYDLSLSLAQKSGVLVLSGLLLLGLAALVRRAHA